MFLCRGLLYECGTQERPLRVELRAAPGPALPISGHLHWVRTVMSCFDCPTEAYLDRIEPPADQTDQDHFVLLEDASAGLCCSSDMLKWKTRSQRQNCRSMLSKRLVLELRACPNDTIRAGNKKVWTPSLPSPRSGNSSSVEPSKVTARLSAWRVTLQQSMGEPHGDGPSNQLCFETTYGLLWAGMGNETCNKLP